MTRRALVCLLSIALALPLGGCWNYRGLDQINIVLGVAVDFDKEANLFDLTFEVADLAGAERKGSIMGRLTRSRGATLFDTVRNAKRKEADKLYFGSANLLIINQEIAREKGIEPVIEWFLRDGECRETMSVVISQEETAAAILERPKEMHSLVSVVLYDIIREDRDVTASSLHTQLYEIPGMIYSPRRSILMPALHKVRSAEETVPELNGAAVLKRDKLVGFLTPEQSRYALFVQDRISSSILTPSSANMQLGDMSLELTKNKTKKSFACKEDGIVVRIDTKTRASIIENPDALNVMDEAVVEQIQDAAAQVIESGIRELMDTMQNEYRIDAFGFGEMIYQQDLELWRQLEPYWEDVFPILEIEVFSEVQIVNTAFIKQLGG